MPSYPEFNLFRVLTYPMGLSPLIIIAITALVITIALVSPITLVYEVAAIAIILPLYLKYLFLILTATADGESECPVLPDTLARPFEDLRYLKLLALLVANASLMGAIGAFSPMSAAVYLLVFILLLPAMILVIGGEDSLLKTANLPLLVGIVNRSGPLYWAVFAFCIAAVGLIHFLSANHTALYFVIFTALYLVLAAFHLLGVILYTRREELGYQAMHTPEREQQELSAETHKRHQQAADILHRQDCKPAALEEVDRLLENESLDVYDFLLGRVLTWDNTRAKQRYMNHYLGKYLNARQLLRGMKTYESVLQRFPDLTVSDESLRDRLVNHLKELKAQHPNYSDIERFLAIIKAR